MKIRFRELKIEHVEIYKVPGITLESMSPVTNFTWIPGIHVYLVRIQSGLHGKFQVNRGRFPSRIEIKIAGLIEF